MNESSNSDKTSLKQLNIAENRATKKYTYQELVVRVLWSFGRVVFRLTPRPMFGVRRWVLRRFGARVGKNVHIYPSVIIYFPWNLVIGDDSAIGEHALIYNLGMVSIGQRATVSQRAHLCGGSHDIHDPAMPLLKLPIQIQDDSWVCADAFVGPGTIVGRGAVVGARAVVTKDVDEWTVVAGNPAIQIKNRSFNQGETKGGSVERQVVD